VTSHHNATVANLAAMTIDCRAVPAVVGNQQLESSQYKRCPRKRNETAGVFLFGLAYLHLFARDVYDTLVSVVGELNRNFRDHQRLYWRYRGRHGGDRSQSIDDTIVQWIHVHA
jgi:hypothetical protein